MVQPKIYFLQIFGSCCLTKYVSFAFGELGLYNRSRESSLRYRSKTAFFQNFEIKSRWGREGGGLSCLKHNRSQCSSVSRSGKENLQVVSKTLLAEVYVLVRKYLNIIAYELEQQEARLTNIVQAVAPKIT